jgi:YtcA family
MGSAGVSNGLATRALAAVSAAGCSGCDPVLNIAGANFPAWLVCALAGAFGAALLRPLFVALRLEAYLWPAALVYFSLGVLVACVVYLIFFNRI